MNVGAAGFIQDGQGRVLLIKENYGSHRFGFPGGQVEPGESVYEAVIREVREETSVDVQVDHLIAIDRWHDEHSGPWLAALFSCRTTSGVPAQPNTGEIAEVLWVDPAQPPAPLTRMAGRFLQPAVQGARGIVGWLNEEVMG